jgi:hypothetical protein
MDAFYLILQATAASHGAGLVRRLAWSQLRDAFLVLV